VRDADWLSDSERARMLAGTALEFLGLSTP